MVCVDVVLCMVRRVIVDLFDATSSPFVKSGP